MAFQIHSIEPANVFLRRNAFFVAIVCLIIVIAAGVFLFKLNLTGTGKSPQVSPHILSLTDPVTVIAGKVVSVGNDSFVLLLQTRNVMGAQSLTGSPPMTMGAF